MPHMLSCVALLLATPCLAALAAVGSGEAVQAYASGSTGYATVETAVVGVLVVGGLALLALVVLIGGVRPAHARLVGRCAAASAAVSALATLLYALLGLSALAAHQASTGLLSLVVAHALPLIAATCGLAALSRAPSGQPLSGPA